MHNGLSVNKRTLDMLSEVIHLIDDVVANSTVAKTQQESDVDFIFNLRSDFYKIRPYIACCLCAVS